MKPDWKDAPEWAKYLAQDENGEWFWFENKPTCHAEVWFDHTRGQYDIADCNSPDWTESLEQRP